MAWCVGNTIHLCHDSLVYQMLSAVHQTAESAGKGTAGTDEVTASRTVPFLYGRWLDFGGTHGGLGKSVPGISQPWRERNPRQQTGRIIETAKQKTK